MIFISIIGFLFFFDKKKMLLFTQSIYKTDYHSLYITRNLQFTFFRFLFLIGTIISFTSWVNLIIINSNVQVYFVLLSQIITLFFIRYIFTLLIGLIIKNLFIAKKIILITIDIDFLVCILFFPLLLFLIYSPLDLIPLSIITFYGYCFFMLFAKYFLIKKFNHLKDLSFFNIILYLCLTDLIPIISLYKILH
jgi:hypothetical protein